MKVFPFMRPLEGKRCLLVGGGAIALRKAEKLCPFGVRLYVCARECADFSPFGAEILQGEYSPRLLEGMDVAVAATDDRELNARVARDCRARGIPVNSVDDVQNCDFFFPALIVRGEVVVGISTGGASPALDAALGESLGRTDGPGEGQLQYQIRPAPDGGFRPGVTAYQRKVTPLDKIAAHGANNGGVSAEFTAHHADHPALRTQAAADLLHQMHMAAVEGIIFCYDTSGFHICHLKAVTK